MTDRELLELAAKATGLQLSDDHIWHEGAGEWVRWNPLADDGDALRLFTKLPFREMYVSEIGVTVSWRRDESGHGIKCDEYASEYSGDLNAATRRAIVRAVAEIGKEMK
jgi:hypothetical protein